MSKSVNSQITGWAVNGLNGYRKYRRAQKSLLGWGDADLEVANLPPFNTHGGGAPGLTLSHLHILTDFHLSGYFII